MNRWGWLALDLTRERVFDGGTAPTAEVARARGVAVPMPERGWVEVFELDNVPRRFSVLWSRWLRGEHAPAFEVPYIARQSRIEFEARGCVLASDDLTIVGVVGEDALPRDVEAATGPDRIEAALQGPREAPVIGGRYVVVYASGNGRTPDFVARRMTARAVSMPRRVFRGIMQRFFDGVDLE